MNETGHMVVARIAWDVMRPAARKEVLALVADPNNPLSNKPTTDENSDRYTAAAYMDDIRPALENLHFDNQYIEGDGSPTGQAADTPNAVTFFNDNISILRDADKSQDDKAEALRYAFHLAGDLHQPLHCVDRVTPENPKGDRGGNRFPIDWSGHMKRSNLHAYWDDAAGEFAFIERPLNKHGMAKLNALADNIEKQYPMARFGEKVKDLNPAHWAADGLQLAISDCYRGIEPAEKPSPEYKHKTINDMNEQAALAGYRLGTLLNDIFAA